MKSHQIVIVGGGSAGITVAAQLLKKKPGLDIAVVEPSEMHYYQPAWTLVGGGTFNLESTRRPEKSVMPQGTTWIKDRVTAVKPVDNALELASGEILSYQYLVMCPGIQIDYHKVSGLK